jgi:hypothetical protein
MRLRIVIVTLLILALAVPVQMLAQSSKAAMPIMVPMTGL